PALSCAAHPRHLPPSPTRRSSDLDRIGLRDVLLCNGSDHLPIQPELPDWLGPSFRISSFEQYVRAARTSQLPVYEGELLGSREQDRKSTRLNSSHQIISYAVFCLQ